MIQTLTRTLSECLRLPEDAQTYELSLRLAEKIRGNAMIETQDVDFDPLGFARAGHASLFISDGTHAHIETDWNNSSASLTLDPRTAVCEVLWNGQRLNLLIVHLDHRCSTRHYIVAETSALAEAFFRAVCTWADRAAGTILVFRGNMWQRDDALRASIASAKLDDLVLRPDIKERLIDDVTSFFGAREIYQRYGVSWKRGVLLIGPPGNGKTHAIKALANTIDRPCLYVRTFEGNRTNAATGMQMVFRRARNSAPCMLVFEDLDSLLDAKSLSYFLNEMDGFTQNEGVLTIATTNHPQKLDVALLERPSRFDRKINFELPRKRQRFAFLHHMTAKWEAPMRPSLSDLGQAARLTEGFSYAYLKEVGVSSMIAWMKEQQAGSMSAILPAVVLQLKSQMSSVQSSPPPDSDEDDD